MAQSLLTIPSARRLMDSLRDIGYELPAAVADLVDNSLDALATEVDIKVAFEGLDSWIRIADNGQGMTAQRMNEAMRYGSDREYSERDLGKFGLGLKTASMSQCRRVTVATRTNPLRREIEIRRWDLDHVINEDQWDLLRLSTSEVREDQLEPLMAAPGTVVIWEQLDRVLDYKLPTGLAAQHGLKALCRDIEAHLAMVFHRLLSRETRRPVPFAITINDNPVEPWDPYARSEQTTQKLDRQNLTLTHDGFSHTVVVQPYVLPNQNQFSTTRAWEAASGPRKWNHQQGFYFYRGGRMIQSGGWNRLRTADEHTKLARIAIDIPRSADTAFELNVSKMRVIIPAEIRGDLRSIASQVARRAQEAYRKATAVGGISRGPAPVAPRSNPGLPREALAPVIPRENGSTDGIGVVARPTETGVPWQLVRTVLREQLADQPELLERLLDVLVERLHLPVERDPSPAPV